MIDIAGEIVTAITSGAAGSVGSKGAEAVGRLLAALRAKFRDQPASRGALEASVERPDDAAARDYLISVLRDHIGQDAAFGPWLGNLWEEVRPRPEVDANSANIVSGTV